MFDKLSRILAVGGDVMVVSRLEIPGGEESMCKLIELFDRETKFFQIILVMIVDVHEWRLRMKFVSHSS